MFYFDKNDPRVLFQDIRVIDTTLCDGRHFEVKPDVQADFTSMPYPGGFLIFKWNETDIKVTEILKLTTATPVFGHISGKRANTHWICFMK